MSRIDALQHSLSQLMAPLGASTITTALAFLPIAMLPGSAGEFIGMIGVSVIFSIIASFGVSIIVTPAMMAWFDRKRSSEGGPTGRKRWWRDGFTHPILSDGYRASVELVLRNPLIGLVIGIVPTILGIMAVGAMPPQFFPQTERNQFQLVVNLSNASNIEDTQRAVAQVSDIVRDHDGVQAIGWTLGEPGPRVYYNAINNTQGVEGFASGWVTLDTSARTREIIDSVQSRLRAEMPSARVLALPFEQGPPADAPIEFRLLGEDLIVLNELGDELRGILDRTPGVTYTVASLQPGAPIARINADEAAAALAGERLNSIASALGAQLEGVEAGSILEGTESLPVRVIASDQRRSELSDLRGSALGPGARTPLAALGDIEVVPETAVVTHYQGQRSNQILAYLEPYTLPAPVFADYQARLAASDFELPAGYTLVIGGEAANSSDALTDLAATGIPIMLVIAGAIMLVFNSFRLMLLVVVSGVLSMFFGFMGIWLFNLPFGFNGIVGTLGLFGIAVNSSIVVLSLLKASDAAMADDVIAQREIIVNATRHIVATTLTTMGGFVPILMTGDTFWMPLAASIAGGVGGSALIALYFVPAVFRLMTMKPFQRLLGRRRLDAAGAA